MENNIPETKKAIIRHFRKTKNDEKICSVPTLHATYDIYLDGTSMN